ncbi:hypothetical protein [uncultured Tolumonas sp.]|uniref:hypothetical protein n=1 Tax=uncultured Tolumonas sp. TaxID=263765 RepID=UPI00292FEF63|nr:hypothetical protein [uncultured Tolumonas sp.]
MILQILNKKWFWAGLCGISLISGGYRYYLTNFGPAVIQASIDAQAINDFGTCLTVENSPSLMKFCDRFYLEYLPQRTDSKYMKKIVEISKLSPEIIISTYVKIEELRKNSNLNPYPDLKKLSNNQLTIK